jgi:hypothetical protein
MAAARRRMTMTRDDFKALAKGDRVVVIKSGKVYEVRYAARHVGDGAANKQAAKAEADAKGERYYSYETPDGHDGWQMPSFQQWRTGEAKYPNGRLYGPAFVRLKPENVRTATVTVPGLPRPLPSAMVSDVALHTPRPFNPEVK